MYCSENRVTQHINQTDITVVNHSEPVRQHSKSGFPILLQDKGLCEAMPPLLSISLLSVRACEGSASERGEETVYKSEKLIKREADGQRKDRRRVRESENEE